MLARLQQISTLGTVAFAALWFVLVWRMGHPGWAVLGGLVIAGGFAWVLALEFMLLRGVHRDDPAPRASAWQLLVAWWGEVGMGLKVFCWRQPFRSRRWPDQLPPSTPGRRGVVLVHGYVCNRGLWNRWLERLTVQGTPFVAVNLEPVFGSMETYLGTIEQAVQTLERCTGMAPVVVAHSMGGLVVRRWWAEQEVQRLSHLVTLGTPHGGTWLARFARSANAREMRQNSQWLEDLRLRESHRPDRTSHMTCFYSHCDNIVFPPSTAALQGATNEHLPGVAHVHLVDQVEPWHAVHQRLRT